MDELTKKEFKDVRLWMAINFVFTVALIAGLGSFWDSATRARDAEMLKAIQKCEVNK